MIVSIKKKLLNLVLILMAMFVKTNRKEKNHSIKIAQNKQTERITSRHTNTERDKKII